ncbi:hypothetical protein ASD44_09730 [Mesorhizobium sp. Root554]|uniref:hypothetical protein n=1 Tax=unclassified Mesorhizobium TaxID=325217 RepID=UPI0006F5E877|nr:MULTISPECIES: hypothetical protein [unclassified Mesorhizobium]KQZ14322.1 hypothetical protein ASD27_09740 [Mesorhizobium sp. Root1471]KQZ36833.1 hypothetical protein ASD44_09730 [Mesorhizobium sp. Root554]
MSVFIELTDRDAGCLSNAIRREIESVERRRRVDCVLDIDAQEYLRQLDACREAVDKAFER